MEYKVDGGALQRGVEKCRLRSKDSNNKGDGLGSGSSARPPGTMWDHPPTVLQPAHVKGKSLKITISRNIVVETCSPAFSVVPIGPIVTFLKC